ncbi:hypothetical protein K3495_g11942 [Podosphaera aphanis]|nr:hypothetical protein K3495_g11942 [Podosphaera aphanis]
MILFKQAFKEKAGRWYVMVSTLARFNVWKFGPLLQDFIATHHEKIGKDDQNSQGEFKGKLGNTQSSGQDQAKNARTKNQNLKGKDKGFRCWNCGKFCHVKTKCPNEKDEAENKTSFVASKDRDDIGPPPVIADEYCQIKEKQLTGQHFAAQAEPDIYDQATIRDESDPCRDLPADHRSDETDSILQSGHVNVTEQILSTAGVNTSSDRWLFDTGVDIDATNKRQNFRPGTVVELKPCQFPIQTGNGFVYAECIGEVWLPLTGPNGSKSIMRLKYVVYIKEFPLNIVSGERFYRKGGRLKGEQIVSPNGEVLSYIDADRRGFFLWLYNQPEPVKSLTRRKNVSVTSTSSAGLKKILSDEESIH